MGNKLWIVIMALGMVIARAWMEIRWRVWHEEQWDTLREEQAHYFELQDRRAVLQQSLMMSQHHEIRRWMPQVVYQLESVKMELRRVTLAQEAAPDSLTCDTLEVK